MKTNNLILLLLGIFLFATLPLSAQTKVQIKGTVVDESGDPLPGAAILTKDGKRGGITDANGAFEISILPSDAVLEVSYLGYTNQEIVIGKRTVINVTMLPDKSNTLNDVVVIGYGTSKKQDLTGSVAVVKMADIENSSEVSIDHALQGRIAGVDIMTTDGEPGAATSIRVRGTRSITASNEPLIVLDGVVGAVESFNDINPSDIQSVSVLKDASSTAIYGSRGANGVVIVTTKEGATAKPLITFSTKFGVSKRAGSLDLMDASEFVRYRNDYVFNNAYINSRGTNISSPPQYDIQDYPYNTNWIDAISRTAFYQYYNISASAKAKNTSYHVAAGYVNEEGIIKGSGFGQFSARLRLSHKVNDWLTVGLNLSGNVRNQDLNKATLGGSSPGTGGALYLSPVLGELESSNPFIENSVRFNTPVANIMYQIYNRKTNTRNDVLDFTIKPIKNLVIKSQLSYAVVNRHDYRFWPSYMPAKEKDEGADAYRYESDITTLATENTASWKTRIGRSHSIDVMAGFSASERRMNGLSLRADGLVTDRVTWNNMNIIGSKENYTASSSTSKVVKESFFARANYNYRGKYYLTLTGRYDGSSNFAANNKWGFFPSAALKWSLRREAFMRNMRWIDDLSLRASAGRTGNDAIDPYKSLQAYSTTTTSYIFGDTQGVMVYPVRVGNPNLTWETTDLYNVAIEGSFFKNRISLTAEAYLSNTRDLLLTIPTIQSTGYSTRYGNLGRTTNKGYELTLTTHNIETGKLGWSTTLTLSANSQMVLDIGAEKYVAALKGSGDYMMYGYKVGYPLNSLWGFEYAGVWHNSQEYDENVETHEYASAALLDNIKALGVPRFKDQNHDGVITDEDLVWLGTADPDIYGGLQNDVHLGKWKFSLYLTYSLGGKIYNYSETYMKGSYGYNQYRYMLDAWHPVRNPESDLPRAGFNSSILPNSSMVYDASFLRIKSASIQYTFDLKKHSSFFRDLTLGISGENLWLWSLYNGFDPDVSTESSNSALRRVDLNSYPKARKIVFNAQFRF